MFDIQTIAISIAGFIAFIVATFFTGKSLGKKDAEIKVMEDSFKGANDAKQNMEALAVNDDIDDKLKQLHENG
jgi:hypothetical protein